MNHPIATLHYSETLYSVIDPKKQIQTTRWKRDFWTKNEIADYFKKGNPERPRSYIRNVPLEVTWLVKEDKSEKLEVATCDVCGNWDATKRVLEMLAKR